MNTGYLLQKDIDQMEILANQVSSIRKDLEHKGKWSKDVENLIEPYDVYDAIAFLDNAGKDGRPLAKKYIDSANEVIKKYQSGNLKIEADLNNRDFIGRKKKTTTKPKRKPVKKCSCVKRK